jgi:thiamine biosynthesis lipoprotein
MKPRKLFAFALLLLVFFPSFSHPCFALLKENRSLLGTVVEITIISPDESKAKSGMDKAFDEIRRIEDLMSFYQPKSEISRINQTPAHQRVKVGREVFGLLRHAQAISHLTQGSFDITFSPLWHLWGQCAREKRLPSSEELMRAKALVDYRKIRLYERNHEVECMGTGMKVNLGGIAKGYALSRAGDMLRHTGLHNFLINIGGDVLAAGEGREGKGWRIGIQHPRKGHEFIGVLVLNDCFALTSGDYERYFEIKGGRYHHIIDARSGYPASGCSAVTILTPRLTGDYLPSVALFLLGPEEGLRVLEAHPEVAGLIITPEGRVFTTPNLSPYLERPLPLQIEMAEAD